MKIDRRADACATHALRGLGSEANEVVLNSPGIQYFHGEPAYVGSHASVLSGSQTGHQPAGFEAAKATLQLHASDFVRGCEVPLTASLWLERMDVQCRKVETAWQLVHFALQPAFRPASGR